jgi:hypothetical protein
MDMSDYDSMWYWWRRLQDEHPSAVPVRGAREESTSPHYRPTTPPSVSPPPNPATPPSQTGPSAVGSASFDIRVLRGSARKGTPSPRRASAIAASPSHSAEMQVDSPEMSSADALTIAEALDDPPPRVRFVIPLFFPDVFNFSCSVALLALLLAASEPLGEVHFPCILPPLPYVFILYFSFSCPLIPRSSAIQKGDP